MLRNLPLSITAYANRGVTCYEYEGEGVAEVSTEIMDGMLLEIQVRNWDLRDRKDLGVEKT